MAGDDRRADAGAGGRPAATPNAPGAAEEQMVVIARRADKPPRPVETLAQRQDSLRQALNAVNDALANEDADAANRAEAIQQPASSESHAGGSAERAVRPAAPPPSSGAEARPTPQIRGDSSAMNVPKTQIIRGQRRPTRTDFHQEPVVAWLVIIGGPGLGAFRPLFTGNNTIGRATTNRVPIDFGDDSISSQEQAYVRYDAADREFLFVPNLSKTNVVSVNEHKPTSAVKLQPMDVITMGQTQMVFVPFCGEDFDWSEFADLE